jgi:hypothetical protein
MMAHGCAATIGNDGRGDGRFDGEVLPCRAFNAMLPNVS